MQQPNRNTTALQPLSSAVIRKKPKGPEDGEPSNQPNRNTTALQALFPAIFRKKPKGSAIRTPSSQRRAVLVRKKITKGQLQKFVDDGYKIVDRHNVSIASSSFPHMVKV
ncbi:hypothetical protein PS2_025328 [Malus domestica]